MFRFRWDYLSEFSRRSNKNFPGFQRFRMGGVTANYLKSVFPTDSFPTSQTIDTGLYPGSHGIVAQTFYDPSETNPRIWERRPPFFNNPADTRTTKALKWWNKAFPIWHTGRDQGVKFSTLLWSRYIFYYPVKLELIKH